MMIEIEKIQKLNSTYSYNQFRDIVQEYALNRKTSGEQSEERIAATYINAQRIKRIEKQCVINENLSLIARNFSKKYRWVLIMESWCGDGAQCAPVIAKIAEMNSNIKLEIIFRDDNLEVMDCFLTNGSRSIPKLICIDESNEIIATWGPRPKAIQDKVTEFKKEFPEVMHDELIKNVHLWYAQDKTQSIQEEFLVLLNKLNSTS